jgi:hypothetical protein
MTPDSVSAEPEPTPEAEVEAVAEAEPVSVAALSPPATPVATISMDAAALVSQLEGKKVRAVAGTGSVTKVSRG